DIPRTGDSVTPVPRLRAEGRAPVLLQPFGTMTGVLPPGHYTYSGATDARSFGGTNGAFSFGSAFVDSRLIVAPEPGALPLLAAPMTLRLRRRRRRYAADQ